MDYSSDIVLGNKYRDTQTGLEGIAVTIEFHQHMCQRVVLEVFKNDDLKGWVLDAVRLEPVDAEPAPYVEPTTGGAVGHRSPRRY